MESVKKRNAEIFEKRTKGASLDLLAVEYGISSARIDQIFQREKMKRETRDISDFPALNQRLYYSYRYLAPEWEERNSSMKGIINVLFRGMPQNIYTPKDWMDWFLGLSVEDILLMRHIGPKKANHVVELQNELRNPRAHERILQNCNILYGSYHIPVALETRL